MLSKTSQEEGATIDRRAFKNLSIDMTTVSLNREATAALTTPSGRGAVACWKIQCSPAAWEIFPFRPASSAQLENQTIGRILFGDWAGEEVVVVKTADSEWDLMIHGGTAATQRVQQVLESCGVQIVCWEEMLQSRTSTLEAEYQMATSRTVTWMATEKLLRHPTAALVSQLREWKQELSQPVIHKSFAGPLMEEIFRTCEETLQYVAFGLRLTYPAKIVFAGAPNVGKSSLLNRVAGYERSIVQNQPGTTRDTVGVELALGGFPVTISDTAGLRNTDDQLESAGISRAREILEESDLIVHLMDGAAPPSPEEAEFRERYPRALSVLHKCDQPLHIERAADQSHVQVSALTGAGIEELIELILRNIVPRTPKDRTFFPVSPRQIDRLSKMKESALRQDQNELLQQISHLLDGALPPH